MKEEDNLYILKHRNTDVAEFKIDNISGHVKYYYEHDTIFSPINSQESEISKIYSINDWLKERCIPDSREGIDRIKNKYNINEMKKIMILTYGLSLSDHYWIERKPYNNKWENINLYENDFDDEIGKVLFDKKLKLVKDIKYYGNRVPFITTAGNLKKYWKKDNNRNYLVKGGSRPEYQEPFNEYYASILLKELDYEHIPYKVENYGKEYVSICPCISDIENEMISAVDIIRKYNINRSYEDFVTIGKQKGCISFEDSVNKMIIIDYLTDNVDRHWYNFGIVRDARTGSWKGLTPIYDNGEILWNKDYVDSNVMSESKSFADSNEKCIEYVNIKKYIKKLPDMISIFDEAFKRYDNENRKNEIRKGLSEKVKLINNYINSKYSN